jgi:hypothetical protein
MNLHPQSRIAGGRVAHDTRARSLHQSLEVERP